MTKIEDLEQKPKRKRNYPQVGEPTLREERNDMEAEETEDKKLSVKKVLVSVFAGALAVLLAVSMGVVLLAFAGAAVLFLPMLGGITKK